MSYSQLLDLDTLVAVKKAAPTVTNVPFDVACHVVRAMAEYTKTTSPHIDQNSQIYWQASVKEVTALVAKGAYTFPQVGRALKSMGIESWRKMDGFYVAWSLTQLEILQKHFKT